MQNPEYDSDQRNPIVMDIESLKQKALSFFKDLSVKSLTNQVRHILPFQSGGVCGIVILYYFEVHSVVSI